MSYLNHISLATPAYKAHGMFSIYPKYTNNHQLAEIVGQDSRFAEFTPIQAELCLNLYPPRDYIFRDNDACIDGVVVKLDMRPGVKDTFLTADSVIPLTQEWKLEGEILADYMKILGDEKECIRVFDQHIQLQAHACAVCSQYLYVVLDVPMRSAGSEHGQDVCAFTRIAAHFYQIMQLLRTREVVLTSQSVFTRHIQSLPCTFQRKSAAVRHHVLICDTVNGLEHDVLERINAHFRFFTGTDSVPHIFGDFVWKRDFIQQIAPTEYISTGTILTECQFRSFIGTVVGGTFDQLHEGHHLLLALTAYASCGRVCVGLSTDELLTQKHRSEFLYDFEIRKAAVIAELQLVGATSVDVHAQKDSYGPSATEPELPVLVLSEEFRRAVLPVSNKRFETRTEHQDALVCPLILGGEEKMSSSLLREGKHEFTEELRGHVVKFARLAALELHAWGLERSGVYDTAVLSAASVFSLYLTLEQISLQYLQFHGWTTQIPLIDSPNDLPAWLRSHDPTTEPHRVEFLSSILSAIHAACVRIYEQ